MLKVGLVGVGFLGDRHLAHLLKLENVIVPAIWDTDPIRLHEIAQKFDVRMAASIEELISQSEALVVVTTTGSHFDVGMKIVEAGLPVFIEKPICATAEQGRRLVEMATRLNVAVQVGHIERFNRAFRALGQIKVKPRFVEAHRLAQWTPRGVDVAVIHDLMIHDLDLLLALSGEYPSHIHASGVGVMTPSIDIANARLEFPSGLVANVTASRISLKRMRKMRLFGEQEYIALDLGKGTCEYVGGDFGAGALQPGAEILGEMEFGPRHLRVFRRFVEAPEEDAMNLELASFRDSVLTGTKPKVTGEDGLRALELAEHILNTIRGK